MTKTAAQQTTSPDNHDLPEGWIRAPLLELCEFIRGVSYKRGEELSHPAKGFVSLVRANNINQQLVLEDLRYVPGRRVADKQLLRLGDVVIAISSGSKEVVGKAATVRSPLQAAFGAFCAVCRPSSHVDWRYFGYFFQTREYRDRAYDSAAGVNINNLRRGHFEAIEFPLPPLAEQERIADVLDLMLVRVNATRERLARVPVILKRFRQAVLAAACSGRLTEDYRNRLVASDSAQDLLASISSKRRLAAQNKKSESYKEPLQPDVAPAPEKPNEWVLASMDQLTCLVTSGSRGWAKYYSTSGPVFVRAQDINTDKLILDDVAHVNLPSKAEGQRTRVCVNDLLVTITGANVTKSAVVTSDIGEAYVSQHVALVRPVVPAIAGYLYLWLVSPMHGRAKLLNDAYGAGKPGLNLEDIKEIVVSLPSLSEQQEIVLRVEALFKLADGIERRVAAGTRMAESLTQAVLGKAVRGELVPTEAELARREERSYESGVELLSRITATRRVMIVRARKTSSDSDLNRKEFV